MTALRKLLENLIDYAGLFPPAELPMAATVKNYQKYIDGPNRWMLGKLILPASRLAEFVTVFNKLFPDGVAGETWPISALIPELDAADNAFAHALESVDAFNEAFEYAKVDTVEGKLTRAGIAEQTIETIPSSLAVFLEMPATSAGSLIGELSRIATERVRAKVRTGGVESHLIPDLRDLASFIHQCAEREVGFKATAGLHHPLRGEYPLSYETDAPRAVMHGFLNVFVAACFAKAHAWSVDQLATVLECTDPAAFEFSERAIIVGDEVLEMTDVAAMRDQFAISFGSCSFSEPVDEVFETVK